MAETGQNINVLITDDHLIVREGLRLILETAEGIEIVGEASDGSEALRLAAAKSPDVILMDLRMPGMDGLTAIEQLQAEHPHIAVLILTTFDEDDLILSGLRAGARGYLLKDTTRETLIGAIRAASRGETLLTQDIVERLLTHTQPVAAPVSTTRGATTLTDRELQVLQEIARGERNKEIARSLGITERTVKAHVTSIFNRLGVDSRAAAIAVAARRGLLTEEL
ncbi:MAG: response regulator transcription factor [Chloroflexota bacterium]|nr:response regulator transcription factor [Chloroflexota bacterium]